VLRATNIIARRSTISASCGDSRNPPTQRRCTVNACTPLLHRCCYTRDRPHILFHTNAAAAISIIQRGTISERRLTRAATRPARMRTTTMRRCPHLCCCPRVHAKWSRQPTLLVDTSAHSHSNPSLCICGRALGFTNGTPRFVLTNPRRCYPGLATMQRHHGGAAQLHPTIHRYKTT